MKMYMLPLIGEIKMYKRFSIRRLLKEYSNEQEKKRTMNDFLRKFGTIGSTERTVVSGRLFLCYF